MGRIAILAGVLYGWGTPAFEGHRPDALDRPLREFHRTVNAAAADSRRTLSSLQQLRALPDLPATLRRLNSAF